jgi:hypothetical protein
LERSTHDLTRCPACGAGFVVPVRWHEAGDTAWRMGLRCGECGARRSVRLSDAEAEHYARELDRGVAEIAMAAASMDRRRWAEQVEAFAWALRHDLIGADDFSRSRSRSQP